MELETFFNKISIIAHNLVSARGEWDKTTFSHVYIERENMGTTTTKGKGDDYIPTIGIEKHAFGKKKINEIVLPFIIFTMIQAALWRIIFSTVISTRTSLSLIIFI